MNDLFYIEASHSCVGNVCLWWRHDSAGYTDDLSQAGQYDKADADQIHANRKTDIPRRVEDVDRIAKPMVKVWDVKKLSPKEMAE